MVKISTFINIWFNPSCAYENVDGVKSSCRRRHLRDQIEFHPAANEDSFAPSSCQRKQRRDGKFTFNLASGGGWCVEKWTLHHYDRTGPVEWGEEIRNVIRCHWRYAKEWKRRLFFFFPFWSCLMVIYQQQVIINGCVYGYSIWPLPIFLPAKPKEREKETSQSHKELRERRDAVGGVGHRSGYRFGITHTHR